jgi:hypothetical protein
MYDSLISFRLTLLVQSVRSVEHESTSHSPDLDRLMHLNFVAIGQLPLSNVGAMYGHSRVWKAMLPAAGIHENISASYRERVGGSIVIHRGLFYSCILWQASSSANLPSLILVIIHSTNRLDTLPRLKHPVDHIYIFISHHDPSPFTRLRTWISLYRHSTILYVYTYITLARDNNTAAAVASMYVCTYAHDLFRYSEASSTMHYCRHCHYYGHDSHPH